MTVHTATLADLEDLVTLFDAYRVWYRKPSDVAAARAFLQARLANQESVIFLAKDHDQAAGFVQLYPSFTSLGMKRLWVLNDLYVAPEFRKQGVGTALLERAQKLGQETDASSLMLETEVNNHSAKALYEKLGFEKSTEYEVYYLGL